MLKEKFGLDSLVGIRNAYAAAFKRDGDAVNKLLSNRPLDALSFVRNLIVHRGGIIDAEYEKKTRGIDLCPKGTKGEPLELNGEVVASLAQPTMLIGNQLISAVDDWLQAH